MFTIFDNTRLVSHWSTQFTEHNAHNARTVSYISRKWRKRRKKHASKYETHSRNASDARAKTQGLEHCLLHCVACVAVVRCVAWMKISLDSVNQLTKTSAISAYLYARLQAGFFEAVMPLQLRRSNMITNCTKCDHYIPLFHKLVKWHLLCKLPVRAKWKNPRISLSLVVHTNCFFFVFRRCPSNELTNVYQLLAILLTKATNEPTHKRCINSTTKGNVII